MSRLQKITDLRKPPVVGKWYLVPCVVYNWHGMKSLWPVIGPLHHDKEIGFNLLHFHIDARFLTKRQAGLARQSFLSQWPKYNSSPLSEPVADTYNWAEKYGPIARKPTFHRKKCSSLDYRWHPTTTPKPESLLWSKFGPTPCAIERPDGRLLCPHKKVDLSQFEPDADGIVICPLHGLKVRTRFAVAQSNTLGQTPA